MHTGIRTSASVFALLLAVGCGSAAIHDRASVPQHQWTEADWYAQAIDEAFEAYEADVVAATSVECHSQAEADAVAQTVSPRRFDAHLANSLRHYGLSMRGLRVFGEHHPEFVQAQTAANQPRMEGLLQATARITLVRPGQITLAAFDVPEGEQSNEQLASR